jgi:hypothetical protein
MCDNALVSGFALGRQPVNREILLEVARDFNLGVAPGTPMPPEPGGTNIRSETRTEIRTVPLENAVADDTSGEGPQMNAFRRGMALFGGKRR